MDHSAETRAQVQQLAQQHGADTSAESIASLVENVAARSVAADKRMIH
jgi:hypothetical protein